VRCCQKCAKLQCKAAAHITKIVREHNMLIHNVDIYARDVGMLMLNSVITWSIV